MMGTTTHPSLSMHAAINKAIKEAIARGSNEVIIRDPMEEDLTLDIVNHGDYLEVKRRDGRDIG